ncbi:hypothetical protein ACTABX_07145 [Pseudomonas syringae]
MDEKPVTSAEPNFLLAKAKHTVERKRRARIVKMILPGLLGVLLFVIHSVLSPMLNYNLTVPFGLLSIVLIGVSAGFVVVTYLQTGFALSKEIEVEAELAVLREPSSLGGIESILGSVRKVVKSDSQESLSDDLRALREEIQRLKVEVDKNSYLRMGEPDHESMRQFLDDSAAEVAVKAHSLLAAEVTRQVKSDYMNLRFDECRARLLQEIRDLNRKGNTNLAIGAGISTIGILLLGVTLVYEVTESRDMLTLASHYLPRLSLIILIEVFAYFFLRLYKSGLVEVKYFQNELTNIEARQISMEAAREAGDNALIGVVVTKLADTERNHILTKDQTTVELEKAKLESESKVAFGKFVTDFFQKVKPSKE